MALDILLADVIDADALGLLGYRLHGHELQRVRERLAELHAKKAALISDPPANGGTCAGRYG